MPQSDIAAVELNPAPDLKISTAIRRHWRAVLDSSGTYLPEVDLWVTTATLAEQATLTDRSTGTVQQIMARTEACGLGVVLNRRTRVIHPLARNPLRAVSQSSASTATNPPSTQPSQSGSSLEMLDALIELWEAHQNAGSNDTDSIAALVTRAARGMRPAQSAEIRDSSRISATQSPKTRLDQLPRLSNLGLVGTTPRTDPRIRELLKPLVEAVAKQGMPGLHNMTKIKASLAHYDDHMIQTAAAGLAQVVNEGRATRPFGLLVSQADQGVEWFAPAPASTAKADPTVASKPGLVPVANAPGSSSEVDYFTGHDVAKEATPQQRMATRSSMQQARQRLNPK